ncbi:hypothetical protein AN958_00705 [Leucoagaricus sp. SymC.cos]|nr:hypothetical protein AN958_00705 [Leucoagaricus sp. SymC.cos]
MPSSETIDENSPTHGRLGTSWEIAIVVVFVCLVTALIGTFIFQVRRKQKEKLRRAIEAEQDLEKGKRKRTHGKGRVKRPDSTHSRESERRGDSSSSGGIITEEPELDGDAKGAEPVDSDELTKPPPVVQTKRLSRSSCQSSYHEYIAKKPPKYYWDQR